ncbi:MAG: hypothetical protein OEV29_13780 [Thermoleophilia bacterium]|nr:hypothetical protein [Thermoleophilia bacterium]
MPESYGKRQRQDVKARKAAAREERRLARAKRDADREAGLVEAGTPIEATDPAVLGLPDDAGESGEAPAADVPRRSPEPSA